VEPQLWNAAQMMHLSAQAGDFDLVHAHGDFLPLSCGPLFRTPVVTTLYDSPAPWFLSLLRQYAGDSYFVATSVASRIREVEYIATVSPGVDLAVLPYREAPGTYLVFCGRLHPDEEVTTALEIAQRYRMKLILAGLVTDQQYFQTQIAPCLGSDRVVYAGALEPMACHDLLAGAYALLHPSRMAKPFSLSAVEAMACGTPVVAWKAGAMPEIVRDGETGYLVAEVDEAVARLRQVAELDRQRCRQWVAERFSSNRMVSEYIAVYQRILEREKPHAHHASPPWGRWEVLLDEPAYKVKRITVLPGKRLSYQKHYKREEHWTVVRGQALVTLDGRDISLNAGATLDIPCGAAHRIANAGSDELVFIEVQCGTYFGEDDIVRLQDDYGRASA
jgi:mannose-6-phosphate isomerase-like protein (cupin superfamily)